MTVIVKNPPEKLSTFIHTSKCGGVSISNWLNQHVGGEWFLKDKKKHLPVSSLYNRGYKKNYLGWKFTSIRNPFDRLVSAYFYTKNKRNHPCLKTFPRFVKHEEVNCCTLTLCEMTRHVDYIIRFENMEEDFKVVQNFYGCYEPLPIKNTTKHKDYREYYDTKLIDYVNNRWKEDLEKFNYSFE